ncbi:MAG: hypothetical protein Q4C25_02930 [Bacillota bacterium]|nr:hypothetical protein [Bacillota bacterium]
MYIRNNTIAVIFRVIFMIVCGAGLIMKLIYSGFSLNTVMGDFALIANLLALIYFAYLIIARPGYERGALRGAVTIYMVVVFIVYYFIHFGTGGSPVENLGLAGCLLYFAAPLMAFADYLLFCVKGCFTAYSPAIWVILPVIFNLAVFLINRLGLSLAAIPYFNLLGMNLIITLLVFLGISYLLFVVDNLMAGRRR